MGAIIKCLFTRELLPYQPEKWAQRLGERCNSCHQSISYEKAISPCKCYYFCHTECFKKAYQTQIRSELACITCEKCRSELSLNFKVKFKYNPEITGLKLCKLIVSWLFIIAIVLVIILTAHNSQSPTKQFFLLYLQGVLLALALYFLGLSIRDLLFKKVIKITEINTTKLDIQTSAFQDIELDTNEELTRQQLHTVKI